MKSGLHETDDELTIRQLTAVELSLKSAVQGLGFIEFKVASGEPFDPGRMECLGFEEGASGQVTSFCRPGYAIGNIVIRPAGVMIASPETQEE
jgi:molecular chaperone GrpE (heat shock protein)